MKKHNLIVNLSSFGNHTRNAKPKNLFASINSCNTDHIFMGNSSPLPLQGQCSIETIDDMINNVLYVPNLSTNLLSIYQITNFVSRKTILFTLHFCFMKLRTLHKLLP